MGKLRKLSAKELFAVALRTPLDDPDSNDSWDAVHELRTRATPKIYSKARKLCNSRKPNKRQVGNDILAQFGRLGTKPYRKQRLRLLLKMIENETNPVLLRSLAISLGHFYSARANPALLKLKNHSDAEVRYAVAFGLYTYDDKHPDAIAALIELSADSNSYVRDWATFRLGSQDFDTSAIRAALYARLHDPDDNTRGEAIKALAQRRDPRVLEPLLVELQHFPDMWGHPLEAAKALADARLLPALRSLHAECQWRGLKKKSQIYKALLQAILACEAGAQVEN
jgi:HEAT repeat protein